MILKALIETIIEMGIVLSSPFWIPIFIIRRYYNNKWADKIINKEK